MQFVVSTSRGHRENGELGGDGPKYKVHSWPVGFPTRQGGRNSFG